MVPYLLNQSLAKMATSYHNLPVCSLFSFGSSLQYLGSGWFPVEFGPGFIQCLFMLLELLLIRHLVLMFLLQNLLQNPLCWLSLMPFQVVSQKCTVSWGREVDNGGHLITVISYTGFSPFSNNCVICSLLILMTLSKDSPEFMPLLHVGDTKKNNDSNKYKLNVST